MKNYKILLTAIGNKIAKNLGQLIKYEKYSKELNNQMVSLLLPLS